MNVTVTVNGVVVEVGIPDKAIDTRESIPLDAVGVHEVTDIDPVPDEVEA